MALHLLRITGARTHYLTDVDAPDGLFAVNRRGLGMPEGFYVPAQVLQGHRPVHPTENVERDAEDDITALVGLWAFSRDSRQGIRLIRRTENQDHRFFAALRFDVPTWGALSADDIVSAHLYYRVRPWQVGGEPWANSAAGCDGPPVAEAQRLTLPLTDALPVRAGRGPTWPVAPPLALPLPAGQLGLDVTGIVREWHGNTRLDAGPLAGLLLLQPGRPTIRRSGVESVPLFPNRRRRTHWVREPQWRVSSGFFEFRCARLLGHFQIHLHTRD